MSDDQFKDLKNYLDERFDAQDSKFDKRFDEFEAWLDAKADRRDLERIYDALDTILRNQEIEQQERAAIIAQLERHERWHHQPQIVSA